MRKDGVCFEDIISTLNNWKWHLCSVSFQGISIPPTHSCFLLGPIASLFPLMGPISTGAHPLQTSPLYVSFHSSTSWPDGSTHSFYPPSLCFLLMTSGCYVHGSTERFPVQILTCSNRISLHCNVPLKSCETTGHLLWDICNSFFLFLY